MLEEGRDPDLRLGRVRSRHGRCQRAQGHDDMADERQEPRGARAPRGSLRRGPGDRAHGPSRHHEGDFAEGQDEAQEEHPRRSTRGPSRRVRTRRSTSTTRARRSWGGGTRRRPESALGAHWQDSAGERAVPAASPPHVLIVGGGGTGRRARARSRPARPEGHARRARRVDLGHDRAPPRSAAQRRALRGERPGVGRGVHRGEHDPPPDRARHPSRRTTGCSSAITDEDMAYLPTTSSTGCAGERHPDARSAPGRSAASWSRC